MDRWEMLYACERMEAKIDRDLSMHGATTALERVFSLDDSDLDLGSRWVDGDLDAIEQVAFKLVFDERVCGRLAYRGIHDALRECTANEYEVRGYKTLPNGMPLSEWNIAKLISLKNTYKKVD